MMNKEQLKAALHQAIVDLYERTQQDAQTIFQHPELGYKEVKTSAYVQRIFDQLGLTYEKDLALTGVKTRLSGRKHNKTVAFLGELDAIVCRRHPAADPVTGAAHCCGHNVQIANLLVILKAFLRVNAMEHLGGDVVFFAVPAEEFAEIEYRNQLRKEGKIEFLGGKAELISKGAFDDIDMAMQMHVDASNQAKGKFGLGASSNGFIGKIIEYRGKAAHAAAAPHQGVNALNACMMGVMGVNALRETFREKDYVRFHPIINAGGDLVNVIPDYVSMESYVRAANIEAMLDANSRINQALQAGAMALGATCRIQDIAGYLPLRPNESMRALLQENAQNRLGQRRVYCGEHAAGSTDMGDVSHLMPVIHPWIQCCSGFLHGANYRVSDPWMAYVQIPSIMANTIVDLLWDEAQRARKICEEFQPALTKDEYLTYMRQF